jgi:WD40 repeat protein
MTEREHRRVIESPARRVGLELEQGLTDVILADVGDEPGALPLLSTALFETWARRDDTTLTIAGYQDAGGVAGALTNLAESVYERFSPDEQTACRRILLRLAEPSEGDDDVRRRASVTELVAPDDLDAATVLATLTDRRLITAGADGVEVAHEALLREWPRARAWLEDDREGRRLHHRLAASAAEWDAANRDPAELCRGARLASALDWLTAHPGEANRLERDFLETASTLHDAELRTARRSARRLRALLAATVVLLVVAILAGGLAIIQRGQARDQDRAAELTRLAAQVLTLPADELSRALLLAVEGRRLQESDITEGALQAALANAPAGLERLIQPPGGIGYGGVSPNGRRLVAAGRDGKARIVAVSSGRVLRTLDMGGNGTGIAHLSPEGHLVVVSRALGEAGTVRLFSARSGRPVGPTLQSGTGVILAQFLPNDSARLVTVSPKELIVWDLSDPKRPFQILGPLALPENPSSYQPVTLLKISRDGRTAATSAASGDDLGAGGTTFVWDLQSGARLLGPLTGRPAEFTPDGTQLTLRRPDHIAFVDVATGGDRGSLLLGFTAGVGTTMSPDGQRLAAFDADGAVRVYDVATGQQIGQTLTLFARGLNTMAFLPGDRLVVISQETAAVWRYINGAPAFATLLPGHTGEVDAQFTPDGKEIVTTGITDHQVLRFRARDGTPLGRALEPSAGPNYLHGDISPDGSIKAVPQTDGIVTLWDRRTGTRLSDLPTGQTGGIQTAWNPGGWVVATVSSGDGAILLWDVSDPSRPRELQRLDGGDVLTLPFRSARFSPDGRVLAVNDYPQFGRVTFVDVARGEVLRTVALGGQIGPLLYSPDGKTIITMRYTEGTLLLLDAATGRIRAFRRVTGWPHSWGFVHEGRRIVIQSEQAQGGSGPRTLELWDATTLESIGKPATVTSGVSSVLNTNADGTKLVIGTEGVAVLVDLNPRHWVDIACRLAGRNLTRAEWDQYFPGREYHRTCPV